MTTLRDFYTGNTFLKEKTLAQVPKKFRVIFGEILPLVPKKFGAIF